MLCARKIDCAWRCYWFCFRFCAGHRAIFTFWFTSKSSANRNRTRNAISFVYYLAWFNLVSFGSERLTRCVWRTGGFGSRRGENLISHKLKANDTERKKKLIANKKKTTNQKQNLREIFRPTNFVELWTLFVTISNAIRRCGGTHTFDGFAFSAFFSTLLRQKYFQKKFVSSKLKKHPKLRRENCKKFKNQTSVSIQLTRNALW